MLRLLAAAGDSEGDARPTDPGSGCNLRVWGAGYGSQMATVLITQCLQRDFVDPIGPHDPLPNLLHV
ncbi:MAG TPA: hypothetical protein VHZ27_13830, partial [Solirubrobacteraceae bacterium]|nr:hypothetical protein [Solirubrobacteraceae bacterium]